MTDMRIVYRRGAEIERVRTLRGVLNDPRAAPGEVREALRRALDTIQVLADELAVRRKPQGSGNPYSLRPAEMECARAVLALAREGRRVKFAALHMGFGRATLASTLRKLRMNDIIRTTQHRQHGLQIEVLDRRVFEMLGMEV